MSMMQSGVELTITTFGTLLTAGAEAHDYALVQKASSADWAQDRIVAPDMLALACMSLSHQTSSTALGGHSWLRCFCLPNL